MIQLLLTPLVLALPAGEHAHIHPANVDVFLECSDVQAALKSYEHSPLVALLNDPAIAKIGEVAQQLGVDLKSAVQGVMPVPDPKRPEDRYWPWSAAQGFSLSLSDVDTQAATGVAPGERTSGWCVIDFANEDAAAQVLAAIGGTGGVTTVAVQGEEPLSLDGHALPLTHYEMDLFGTRVAAWFARNDARLIAGIGRARPGDLVARLAHPETSFAEKHKLLAADAGFKNACGTTIVRAWSDLERVALVDSATISSADSALLETFLPGFLPFLGQRGRYRLQLCGDRFVSESLTERIGAAKQLDDLYGSGPVPASTARMIPKEAVGAWLLSLEPARLENFLETTLGGKRDATAQPADQKGPRISAAVGTSAALFLLPFSVGSLASGDAVPGAMLVIPLQDGAAFKTGFEALLDRLQKSDPKMSIENKPYHKLPMYTLSHRASGAADAEPEANPSGGIGGQVESALHPTVVILSDRVLVAPNRKYAQAEVRRIESKPTDVHPLALEGAIPKDAYEVSSMDWGAFVGKLYDGARGLLPMIAQGGDKTIDVNALPTAVELFRFFKPSASYSTRVDGRTYTYSESSFGPESPLAIALFTLGMSRTAIIPPSVAGEESGAIPGSTGTEPTPPVKAPKPGVIEADPQKDATIAALRRVKTGLAIYRSQFSRVPDTLDELLKGTEAFPKGFLEGNAVPVDGWGRALVFEAQDKGAKFALRSLGPNGVDDHGAGDDVTSP